jgi:hypothetical protein
VPCLEIRGKPLADPPFDRFFDFISPMADRYGILESLLDELQMESRVFPIAGNRHFFIFPRKRPFKASEGKGFPFRGQNPVILTAHYDRVPGSPGANDNSAGVFLLLKTALRLREQQADHWIMIFTDKEELGKGEHIEDQGSYTLGETLRQGGLGDARVFIFDSCGTGDTLVISTTTEYLFKNSTGTGVQRTLRMTSELRNKALETARRLNMDRVLLLPTPVSDDAGFLRAGIAAQTITVLPMREAAAFAFLIRKNPEFAEVLLYRELQKTADRQLIPETWRCINSPADKHERLTPEHFGEVLRFAETLCKRT